MSDSEKEELEEKKTGLEDSDSEESDGGEEEVAKPSKGKDAASEEDEGDGKRKKGEMDDFIERDDDDDDDDDEEEDEDEEDEEVQEDSRKHKKKKRKKRTGGRQYIDDAADDDDDDEELSDDDGDSKKKKKRRRREEDEDDDEAELDDDEAERLHQQAMARRQQHFLAREDITEDDLNERYRAQRARDDDPDDMQDNFNAQNARLPDAQRDPKVWSVKEANNTEKTIVMQIMCKWAALAKTDTPISITSCYWNEQALGYIFIEAHKEAFVKEALAGLRGVYTSRMSLIPVREMVDTVTVIKQTRIAKEGGWARIKRGKYKGDIAQVLSVDHNRGEVEVKLVPRVDTNDYSDFNDAEKRKRKAKFLPPRRPFNPGNYSEEQLDSWGLERTRNEDQETVWRYDDTFYFRGNFVTKRYPVKSLGLGVDVQPELDDLTIFEQDADEDEDAPSRSLTHMTSVHKRQVVLKKGDVVRVKSGELRDLLGDVDSIIGKVVVIRPRYDAIKEKLEFSIDELEKYFETGDHVKVVNGRQAGVTGTVVKVEGEIIQLLTDISHEEIRVFSSDVQDSNEISSGLDVVGAFKLYDMVLLESASSSLSMPSVGVVIQLEKEQLKVLDNHNKVRGVRPADAQPHKKSATAVALDHEQQTVGANDVVRVLDGPYKGKTGTVRHIFRAFLFLYSPSIMTNAGTYVVRSRQVSLMGQSKHKENDVLNAGGPPGSLRPMGFGGRDASQGPGGMQMRGPMGRGAGRGNMLEGKRIRITKGFDKGKVGTVKEESDTIVRVELDATSKRVAVKKTDIVPLDGSAGGMRLAGAYGAMGAASKPSYGGGSDTPMWVPQTPAHDGSQTPNPYQDSANTPSTPRNSNYFDANTPGTPAHEPVGWEASTPATPGMGYAGASPYEQQAATPATPSGYGNAYPTPGGYNPQTPGDAPTPHTPATPGGSGYGAYGGAAATPYDQQSPLTPQTPATPGGDQVSSLLPCSVLFSVSYPCLVDRSTIVCERLNWSVHMIRCPGTRRPRQTGASRRSR